MVRGRDRGRGGGGGKGCVEGGDVRETNSGSVRVRCVVILVVVVSQ